MKKLLEQKEKSKKDVSAALAEFGDLTRQAPYAKEGFPPPQDSLYSGCPGAMEASQSSADAARGRLGCQLDAAYLASHVRGDLGRSGGLSHLWFW